MKQKRYLAWGCITTLLCIALVIAMLLPGSYVQRSWADSDIVNSSENYLRNSGEAGWTLTAFALAVCNVLCCIWGLIKRRFPHLQLWVSCLWLEILCLLFCGNTFAEGLWLQVLPPVLTLLIVLASAFWWLSGYPAPTPEARRRRSFRWNCATALLCAGLLIVMAIPGSYVVAVCGGTDEIPLYLHQSYLSNSSGSLIILSWAAYALALLSAFASFWSVIRGRSVPAVTLLCSGLICGCHLRLSSMMDAIAYDPDFPWFSLLPPILAIASIITSILAWLCQRKEPK